MPKIRSTTALIWNYFEKCDIQNKKATCNYCKNTLSYKSTITNLKLHLNKKHIGVYEEYCRTEISNLGAANQKDVNVNNASLQNNEPNDEPNSSENAVIITKENAAGSTAATVITNSVFRRSTEILTTSTLNSTTSSNFGPHKNVQQKVSSYIPKKLTSSEKNKIDKCLLNLVIKDFQPFSIVEDEGFIEYTHSLNPNYQLPNRNTLSRRLLPVEFENRLQVTNQLINEFCLSICLTADCWTSKNLVSYIAVTGHFIHSQTLNYNSILIQCSALEGTHSGVKIANELKTIAEAWRIKEKMIFFVTDNATNMINAANILGWEHFGCYLHKLNLIVQDALNLPDIAMTVQKVQKTVAHFKRSTIAKEKLVKYQINAQGIPPGSTKTLSICVATRWNSIYLMIERFLSLQEALRATIPNLTADLPIIPLEEWKCLQQLCEVLKPFYEVTIVMSAEKYLAASKAIIITKGLTSIMDKLALKSFYPTVLEFITKLRCGITTRFDSIESNTIIGMCSFLDPRFKEYSFTDKDRLAIVRCLILEKVAALLKDDNFANNQETLAGGTDSIWADFDTKVKSVQTPKSAYTKAVEEVDMYVKEALIPRQACPLQWWREHQHIYPSLYLLFIKHGNIMLTSVPCEREFSKAGYIITDRRTRLTSSKVSQIMFLNGNLSI